MYIIIHVLIFIDMNKTHCTTTTTIILESKNIHRIGYTITSEDRLGTIGDCSLVDHHHVVFLGCVDLEVPNSSPSQELVPTGYP